LRRVALWRAQYDESCELCSGELLSIVGLYGRISRGLRLRRSGLPCETLQILKKKIKFPKNFKSPKKLKYFTFSNFQDFLHFQNFKTFKNFKFSNFLNILVKKIGNKIFI